MGIYGQSKPLSVLTFRVTEHCGSDPYRYTEAGEISFNIVKDQSYLISAVNSNNILGGTTASLKIRIIK